MAAVFLTILSAGAIYTIVNLGTTTNGAHGAFDLLNDKLEQVLNPEIIESCSNELPHYDSKGAGSFTFTCNINLPQPTTEKIGGRKSRKSKKSRKNRKSRKLRK